MAGCCIVKLNPCRMTHEADSATACCSPVDAVAWCIATQQALFAADWPVELEQHHATAIRLRPQAGRDLGASCSTSSRLHIYSRGRQLTDLTHGCRDQGRCAGWAARSARLRGPGRAAQPARLRGAGGDLPQPQGLQHEGHPVQGPQRELGSCSHAFGRRGLELSSWAHACRSG